eukprot:m.266268 g.266268  ORF g.266268 m.266268 type:complete len:55 (-) comp26766_c1_seq2:154-318(-)
MPCGHQCVCKAEDCIEETQNTAKCPDCDGDLDSLVNAGESTAQQRAAGKRPAMG